MSWFSKYARSSIGAKQIMALTGLGMVLFLIIHMLGHLGMFAGQHAYNTYADKLQSLGALKWIARGGLVVIVVVHILTALRLVAINRAARPVNYAVYKPVVTSTAARYMATTGLIILAFIIFHLLHFTLGEVQPAVQHLVDKEGHHDVYTAFVVAFKTPALFAIYAVSMFLLLLHLSHGSSSWLQSLGLRHPKYSPGLDKFAWGLTAVLFIGFMAPPTAVLLGMIKFAN